MLTVPHKFQVEGVRAIERFKNRALLADEMGLGKTVQALMWLERNPQKLTIVTMPATAKWNWDGEIKKHLGRSCYVAEGRRSLHDLPTTGIVLINFDILPHHMRAILKARPTALIIDECHEVKNPAAQRTIACREIAEAVPNLIAMSGTPITNRPIEFWSILNMIDPVRWDSYYQFGHRYGRPRRTPWGWSFKGASRTEELYKLLTTTCMIRRRKVDVLKDLPPKIRSVQQIEMNSKDARMYREAKKDVVSWLRTNYSEEAAEKAQRAEMLSQMNVLRQLVVGIKTRAVIDWIKAFLTSGEKLLLFGIHKKLLSALRKEFPQCAFVDGSVTGRKRQSEYERFNTDKKCNLLLGNVKAAGVAWSSTQCSNVAFAEFPWTPGLLSQAEDRCYGMYRGVAGVPTNIWFLATLGTLDESMCKQLHSKQQILSKCLDGIKTDDSMSILEDVAAELLAEK